MTTNSSTPASRSSTAEGVDDPRPALTKLNKDQRSVLEDALEGFQSRRGLVEWCQRAIVATLGHLDDDLFADMVLERSITGLLMADPDAREYWVPRTDPVDDEVAEEFRRRYVAREVAPACTAALRRFRWNSHEYVNDDLEAPDPEVQSHPGMRPAISQLENRQERELRRLLDGYRDEAALVDSFARLNLATYAEHDENLLEDVLEEEHTRGHLLGAEDYPEATEFRERFAAVFLLPAYNRAVRELSDRSTELVEMERGGMDVKSL